MSNESPISTAIATLFSGEMTEQGLADLRKRFPKEVVHDMTVEAEFKAARKIRTERNKLVEAIKDRRIGVASEIKVKADELTNQVELIFASVVGPFESQLETNKLAKEKAERELKELLDGQRDEINGMNNFVTECIGKTSESISGVIEAVDLIDTSCFHKEIIHEAIQTKTNVQSRLAELLTQALNEESLQAEREKLAEQQEEAAAAQRIIDLKAEAQTRLNGLMMIPTGFYGKSSKEIDAKIQSLTKYEVLEAEFGELLNQANSAKIQVINQLTTMSGQQKTVEEAEAQQLELKSVDQEELKRQIAQGKQNINYADTAQARANQQRDIDHLESQLTTEPENQKKPIAETMAKAAPTLSNFGSESEQQQNITITLADLNSRLHDSYVEGWNEGVNAGLPYEECEELAAE